MAHKLVTPGRCLIIAPHPDDETIGAGIWMDRHPDWDVTLLHITDGSPRDGLDAGAAGLRSRRAYAAARRRELREALLHLTPGRRRLRAFSYIDKESYLHLPEIITRLVALIGKLRPALVLSPPYEGGHPDHDTAAFAVACARYRTAHPFRHREFSLYHAGPSGEMVNGEFLAGGSEPEAIRLSEAEQEKKRRMFAAFETQSAILSRFAITAEWFRDVPEYDFTQPPHQGMLLYERWNLGVTGADWRRRASEAL